MRSDQDDLPTLFPLPPPSFGSEVPRRAAVTARAGFEGSPKKLSRSAIIAAFLAKAKERWQGFFEWTGFEKREIDVEIIPGRKCKVAIPQGKPPKLILFRLLPDQKTGGWFTRHVSLWGNLARFDATLCEDLGLPIGRTTLWRLVYGGFVKAYRIAPMTTLIDLDSLMAHLVATKIDGETTPFWTQNRVTTYREWEKLTPAMLARMDAEAQTNDEEGECDE